MYRKEDIQGLVRTHDPHFSISTASRLPPGCASIGSPSSQEVEAGNSSSFGEAVNPCATVNPLVAKSLGAEIRFDPAITLGMNHLLLVPSTNSARAEKLLLPPFVISRSTSPTPSHAHPYFHVPSQDLLDTALDVHFPCHHSLYNLDIRLTKICFRFAMACTLLSAFNPDFDPDRYYLLHLFYPELGRAYKKLQFTG